MISKLIILAFGAKQGATSAKHEVYLSNAGSPELRHTFRNELLLTRSVLLGEASNQDPVPKSNYSITKRSFLCVQPDLPHTMWKYT